MLDFLHEYNRWIFSVDDKDLLEELKTMNDDEIVDAFYTDLEFGTAGLRGVLGAGINRMNTYVVAKATQGLSNDIVSNYLSIDRKVAISYDSRKMSREFACVAAEVFAANGIRVYLFPEINPVPLLSFATRFYHCAAGVMITASHNPAKYNGYKVYNSDGYQITDEAAARILAEIEQLDIFNDVLRVPFEKARREGFIELIPEMVNEDFLEEVKKQSLLGDEKIDKNVSIIYTPLNGTGLVPMTRLFEECGYHNVTIVEEQKNPDSDFTTCPYPNPEIKQAMQLGIDYAIKNDADILIATDPDCDRVGIAVKNKENNYQLISGNQTGVLLLNYILERRQALGKMPKNPVFIKTIVTTSLAEKIAESYGVKTINVLTGFKYIGEQITRMEKEGREEDFLFGYEESYGYLSGTHVRDKDGVIAGFLICEMFAYYKKYHISLLDKLEEIYQKYGYCLNTAYSYEFDGISGYVKMQRIMQTLRNGISSFGDEKVLEVKDYLPGIDNLPESNVLKFIFEKESSLIIRPSGTEPKLKSYITILADNREMAYEKERSISEALACLMN